MIEGRAVCGSRSQRGGVTPSACSTPSSGPAGEYNALNTIERTTTDTTVGRKKPARNVVRPGKARSKHTASPRGRDFPDVSWALGVRGGGCLRRGERRLQIVRGLRDRLLGRESPVERLLDRRLDRRLHAPPLGMIGRRNGARKLVQEHLLP